jgi:lipid II:glycine glycyltransferase (peptidoglycan interpeptide bridge formation enzyme)
MINAFEEKPFDHLLPTVIFQQTAFWGRVKNRLGWSSRAFDLSAGGAEGDILVVLRELAPGTAVAYVPYGPEMLPDDEARGSFLEELSEVLKTGLPGSCFMVRWDLPWESPYTQDELHFDDKGFWAGDPEPHVTEIRMNFGTMRRNLRKATGNLLPTDTIFVELGSAAGSFDRETLFARMRPKTRYNIRLAERKGVSVREADAADLSTWMSLYAETAARNGIVSHGEAFFRPLFSASLLQDSEAGRVKLLIAEAGGEPLAAMFLALSGERATYLYGASSSRRRELMAPYALQWEAMRIAIREGCREYDFFGVAPRPDPNHPLYGLLRFKIGFGGRMFHRQGCWDYPYDQDAYNAYRVKELTESGFHV